MPPRLAPAAAALSAGLAAAACCAAGSLWRQVTLVARVDGDSAWNVLGTQRTVVFDTWRSSLGTGDWLLFAGAGLLAAALVLRTPLTAAARRLAAGFAGARRRTE